MLLLRYRASFHSSALERVGSSEKQGASEHVPSAFPLPLHKALHIWEEEAGRWRLLLLGGLEFWHLIKINHFLLHKHIRTDSSI